MSLKISANGVLAQKYQLKLQDVSQSQNWKETDSALQLNGVKRNSTENCWILSYTKSWKLVNITQKTNDE